MLEALSRNMAFAYRRIAERAGRPTYVDEQVSIADNAKAFVCGPNNVTLLRPDADPAAAVRRADEVFGSRRYLLWSVWPLDLGPLGFVEGHSPAMVCDMSPPPVLHSDLEILEVEDGSTAAVFSDTLTSGFGYDESGLSLSGLVTADVVGDDRLRFWLGSVTGRAVAASWTAVSDGYTGVYGVATIPTMRRRGYGEALTRAAMNAAAHLPAALQSSEAGRPLYLKMGFREIAQFEVWRPTQLRPA
jgi:GNAT superfamily N-acetyltransferase